MYRAGKKREFNQFSGDVKVQGDDSSDLNSSSETDAESVPPSPKKPAIEEKVFASKPWAAVAEGSNGEVTTVQRHWTDPRMAQILQQMQQRGLQSCADSTDAKVSMDEYTSLGKTF